MVESASILTFRDGSHGSGFGFFFTTDPRERQLSTNKSTPPHLTPAFPFNVMAFPFNVMAFPFTGRSHLMEWRSQLPGVPVAWRFWDEESGAALDRGRSRTWGGRVPRHFLRPKRQAMGTPSNWERPVTGNAITLNGNALTLNGNAGVGWGGVGFDGNAPPGGAGGPTVEEVD